MEEGRPVKDDPDLPLLPIDRGEPPAPPPPCSATKTTPDPMVEAGAAAMRDMCITQEDVGRESEASGEDGASSVCSDDDAPAAAEQPAAQPETAESLAPAPAPATEPAAAGAKRPNPATARMAVSLPPASGTADAADTADAASAAESLAPAHAPAPATAETAGKRAKPASAGPAEPVQSQEERAEMLRAEYECAEKKQNEESALRRKVAAENEAAKAARKAAKEAKEGRLAAKAALNSKAEKVAAAAANLVGCKVRAPASLWPDEEAPPVCTCPSHPPFLSIRK